MLVIYVKHTAWLMAVVKVVTVETIGTFRWSGQCDDTKEMLNQCIFVWYLLACYVGSCLKMFIASYVFANFECSQERLIARKHCLLTADNSVTQDSCMAFYPQNHWNWSLGGQLFSSFCSNISKFQWDHLLGCSEIRFCYQGTIFCVKSSIVL